MAATAAIKKEAYHISASKMIRTRPRNAAPATGKTSAGRYGVAVLQAESIVPAVPYGHDAGFRMIARRAAGLAHWLPLSPSGRIRIASRAIDFIGPWASKSRGRRAILSKIANHARAVLPRQK